MQWQIVLTAISIIVGAAASFVSAIMLYQLKALQSQITASGQRMTKIEDDIKKFGCQKDECRKDFVDKVDYIRNVTRVEKLMEKLLEGFSEMNGRLTVVDKLPQISASIAREVIKEMKS